MKGEGYGMMGQNYENVDRKKQVEGPKQHSVHFGSKAHQDGSMKRTFTHFYPRSRRESGFEGHSGIILGSV